MFYDLEIFKYTCTVYTFSDGVSTAIFTVIKCIITVTSAASITPVERLNWASKVSTVQQRWTQSRV